MAAQQDSGLWLTRSGLRGWFKLWNRNTSVWCPVTSIRWFLGPWGWYSEKEADAGRCMRLACLGLGENCAGTGCGHGLPGIVALLGGACVVQYCATALVLSNHCRPCGRRCYVTCWAHSQSCGRVMRAAQDLGSSFSGQYWHGNLAVIFREAALVVLAVTANDGVCVATHCSP
jgi:hypothetical protein